MFVDTNPKSERVAVLKNSNALKDLDDDGTNVFQKSLIDRYEDRANELQSMCLAEFAACMLPNTSKKMQILRTMMFFPPQRLTLSSCRSH